MHDLNVLISGPLSFTATLNELKKHLKFKIILNEKNTILTLSEKIEIHLIPSVNILDEVFLKGLTGTLDIDINTTPEDTIPKANFTYKLTDLGKILPEDPNPSKKPPIYNPINLGGGVGASATIPDFYMIRLRALKAAVSKKKLFPQKIKKRLGIDYFTQNLKISEEAINHFLAYCEYRGIIEKYYNNQLLEVIEILEEESKTYNAIEKK